MSAKMTETVTEEGTDTVDNFYTNVNDEINEGHRTIQRMVTEPALSSASIILPSLTLNALRTTKKFPKQTEVANITEYFMTNFANHMKVER